MKKKLHNGFLLVVMLLATVGSYVSCKDYDEEAYANMLGENSRLEELINAQVAALNGQIDVLEQAQKECKENCEAWKQEITIWQEYVENNYVTEQEFNDHVTAFTALIAENTAKIINLDTKIGNIKDALEAADAALKSELQEEILKVQNDLSTLITSLQGDLATLSTTVAENKRQLEEAIEKNKQAIADNKQAIIDSKAELEQAIADNKQAIADNKQAIIDSKAELEEKIEEEITALEERVAANETAIATINSELASLKEKVAGIETLLNDVQVKANNAYDLAKNDSIRIDALEGAYDELLKLLENLPECECPDAPECDCPEVDNSALIARIDSICGALSIVKESADSALVLATENLNKAKAYTDERIALAVEELKGDIKTTKEELKKAYEAADEKLQEQINDLKESLEAATKRIEANEKKIDELAGKMEKLEKVDESLKQFITGIILQRVENPVFGSYSFPANIQTNILMAYYGYAGSYGAEFPTMKPRFYVSDYETLSEMDMKMLGFTDGKGEKVAGAGKAIVSSAGKVYVTVNPSNINFEGQTLPIVNSLDEESGIKLSELKYSDKKLTFGATTRAAVNGFYEAEAILAAEDIDKVKMTFDFNASDIKETVKDIINPLDGINVTQVANTVYDVLGQFNQNLDANALKASWTDSMGVTRNTYSQYNLAATAIKPLSYSFMKDANFTSFPGFDKMRNVVGTLMDKMANKFKLAIDGIPEFNFDVNHIKHIQFDSIKFDFDKSDVKLVVNYNDTLRNIKIDIEDYINLIEDTINVKEHTIYVPIHGEVTDGNGNFVGYVDIENHPITITNKDIYKCLSDSVKFTWSGIVDIPVNLELEMDKEELETLLNEAGITDINDLIEDTQDKVNEIIDKVNDYLDQLGNLKEFAENLANIGNKIDSANDKVKDKIISYLNKIEDKLLTAVNSINKALQPMMLVNTTSGFQKLSQTIYSPTVMSAANVQFIATSYTAEIVAPAYKKLVGVTNVWSMDRSKNAQNGDADCLAALEAANAKDGVAEILNGDTQVVDFSAKKGYIYEVTYTSVDFSGMVAAKKYYVTVK